MGYAPHINDENHIIQCRRFAAEFAECAEIPSGDSDRPTVGDTKDVDNPGKLGPLPISVTKFSPEDQETRNADVCLRGGQENRNHPQNILGP